MLDTETSVIIDSVIGNDVTIDDLSPQLSFVLFVAVIIFAFSALALLVGRRKEHPACKILSDEVVFLERGANDLHVVQLMPLHPRHLLFN